MSCSAPRPADTLRDQVVAADLIGGGVAEREAGLRHGVDDARALHPLLLALALRLEHVVAAKDVGRHQIDAELELGLLAAAGGSPARHRPVDQIRRVERLVVLLERRDHRAGAAFVSEEPDQRCHHRDPRRVRAADRSLPSGSRRPAPARPHSDCSNQATSRATSAGRARCNRRLGDRRHRGRARRLRRSGCRASSSPAPPSLPS